MCMSVYQDLESCGILHDDPRLSPIWQDIDGKDADSKLDAQFTYFEFSR